jgi:hypothetical protein
MHKHKAAETWVFIGACKAACMTATLCGGVAAAGPAQGNQGQDHSKSSQAGTRIRTGQHADIAWSQQHLSCACCCLRLLPLLCNKQDSRKAHAHYEIVVSTGPHAHSERCHSV